MKKLSLVSIALFCLIACFRSYSQPVQKRHSAGQVIEVTKWEVIDIVFRATPAKGTNPFDLAFGAMFDGPANKSITVNGFYTGKNEWTVRFSSADIGIWTMRTFSSLSDLSGLSCKVSVVPRAGLTKRGAVRIEEQNPQHFVYEDGTPHFMLAFELDWLFALDYDNKSGIPKTKQLLKTVEENGFNHVVMNIYAYDVGWKIAEDVPSEYFYGKPNYSVFGGTNENPDFTTLNLQLFQHLDRVIALMQELNLDAHLMIYVWNKKVKWPDMYSEADNRYFDYVVSRYQAFSNVIWDISKEALDYGRCDIPYINERIARIRKSDAFKRLVTVHDYEYNSRESHRVDFVSIQSWRSALYSIMSEARQIHPTKPVVNIEHGGYESGPYKSFYGNYSSAETCLERTYECIFAGTYGSYYWQNTSWNFVIHDALSKTHSFAPPRFDYYKHLAALFGRYSFNELAPVAAKLTTNSREGEKNVATNGFALINGNGLYLMMLPRQSELVNVVIQKPPSGEFRETWFNPYTGEYQDKGLVKWTGWTECRSPWKDQMSVLIVDAQQPGK